MERKPTKKYYFSVEGETEQWYLEWLKSEINSTPEATCKIVIDCKVERDPVKRAKSLVVTNRIQIYHLSDYESDDEVHTQQFKKTMDRMNEAQALGKSIKYKFGYSNLTFDLWIILHKIACNACHTHRKHYVREINKAFGTSYQALDEYKRKENFEACLNQLTLEDANRAVKRAKDIMQRNDDNGYELQNYKGFRYYKENPSCAVWEVVYQMLSDSVLLKI